MSTISIWLVLAVFLARFDPMTMRLQRLLSDHQLSYESLDPL